MLTRRALSLVLAGTCVTLLAAGCGQSADEPQADESREAGFVTKVVVLCLENGMSSDLDFTPTGPYGEFASVAPGGEACFQGDLTSGDPVAAITFPDDRVIYTYGRNPVFGRPDIRLCADQDCDRVFSQFDLSEGDSKTRTVQSVTYTAKRFNDGGESKLLRLIVGK